MVRAPGAPEVVCGVHARAFREEVLIPISPDFTFEGFEEKLAEAEDKGGQFFAISTLRTGYSYGDEAHKAGAAGIVADRFKVKDGDVRVWYELVLEQEKLQLRAKQRERGIGV